MERGAAGCRTVERVRHGERRGRVRHAARRSERRVMEREHGRERDRGTEREHGRGEGTPRRGEGSRRREFWFFLVKMCKLLDIFRGGV